MPNPSPDNLPAEQATQDTITTAVTTATWTAHFTPQAWVNDYALDIDPPTDADQTWDATTYAHVNVAYLADLHTWTDPDADSTVIDTDDVFRDDPNAPDWIREHTGPFTITLTRTPAKQ